MEAVVLDASVVAKLVFPEQGSEAVVARVRALIDAEAALHVPDLFFVELANIAWKKVRRHEATADDARAVLDVARRLGARIWREPALVDAALEIGLALGCTAYDALYLAVAEHVDGTLLTADTKLAARVSAALPGRATVAQGAVVVGDAGAGHVLPAQEGTLADVAVVAAVVVVAATRGQGCAAAWS